MSPSKPLSSLQVTPLSRDSHEVSASILKIKIDNFAFALEEKRLTGTSCGKALEVKRLSLVKKLEAEVLHSIASM